MGTESIAGAPPRATASSDDADRVQWTAADGVALTIRPIRSSDLTLEQEFVDALSAVAFGAPPLCRGDSAIHRS